MIIIIVINWNGIDDTIECVQSILASDYNNYKLYLIDNNSDDHNRAILTAKYASHEKVNLKLYKQNYGFAKAHNKLYAEDLCTQDYEWLLLLNNDVSIKANCISNMIEFSANKGLDIISSKMVDYYNRKTMDNAGHKIISTGEIVPIGSSENIDQYIKTMENIGACAGGGMYSKLLIDHTGLFDDYFSTGYEDAELGLRGIMLGYKAGYCPTAVVFHKGGNSISKVFNQDYAIQNQRNILYTMVKLYPTFLLLTFYPIHIIRTILIILISIVFLRWNVCKILIKAHFLFLCKDLSKALEARRTFRKNEKILSWHQLLFRLQSFVKFDLDRGFKYLIKRKPSALDQYR